MQYASECRIDAGSLNRGSGATSQSKAVDRAEARASARRDSNSIAVAAVHEARLVVLGLLLLLGRDHPVVDPQLEELVEHLAPPRGVARSKP